MAKQKKSEKRTSVQGSQKAAASKKRQVAGKAAPAANLNESLATVTMDRRAAKERRTGDRRKTSVPVAEERRKLERRTKVSRRRQIDPTTCERDYSDDEVEFMRALDDYKRTSGRMFPTCSEILEVIRKLGYEKAEANAAKPSDISSPADAAAQPPILPVEAVAAVC